MLRKLRNAFGPIFLMMICPPFVMVMWYTNTMLDGEFSRLVNLMVQTGFMSTLYTIWQPFFGVHPQHG